MRSIIYILLLLVAATFANAAEYDRPQGMNCDLSAPPESAGEALNHDLTLRIYPRAQDITQAYTGCQMMWAPGASAWVTISATEILNGDPVRIWSTDGDLDMAACRYRNGRVVSGVAAICPAPELLLVKSLAPGCVEKIKEAVTAGGLGTSWPEGCEYE